MKSFRKISTRTLLVILVVINIALISFDAYFVVHAQGNTKPKTAYEIPDVNKKITDIEAYLDSISSSYITDEKSLAEEYGWSSWGCGPSSYALAKILNKKFFDDELKISASYNDSNPYAIVQRFSLAKSGTTVVDHNWLEIYMKDKLLFVDPSIGQFGKINKVAYQVFDVGQPDITDILDKQYGLDDIRLTSLVRKVVNRFPVEGEPYPGVTIAPKSIGYFLQVIDYRNSVDGGIEPPEWKNWVSFLTKKYQ